MNMNGNLWLTLQCDQGNTWCICCQWVTNNVWYLQKQSHWFNLDYNVIDCTGAMPITIHFIRAVDNGLKVSMRITNKIYSILLAEEGPCRSEKGAKSISHSSHYRKCLQSGCKKYLHLPKWFKLILWPTTYFPSRRSYRTMQSSSLLVTAFSPFWLKSTQLTLLKFLRYVLATLKLRNTPSVSFMSATMFFMQNVSY